MTTDIQTETNWPSEATLPPVTNPGVHGKSNSPEVNTYPAPVPPTTVVTLDQPCTDANGYHFGVSPGPCPAPVATVAAVTPLAAVHTLPVTGGDIGGLSVLGLGCAVAGVVLVRRFRKVTP